MNSSMDQVSLTVASDGQVVIPLNMLVELRGERGGKLVARLVNGTLILEPASIAIQRAQNLVARYIPKDARLTDELITERHAEANND